MLTPPRFPAGAFLLPERSLSVKTSLALAGLLLAAPAALAQSYQTIPSIPLQKFQQSLGFNAHVEYQDGLYNNGANVLADLQYMHVGYLRDSIPVLTPDANGFVWASGGLPEMEQLMAAGIKFDLIADEYQSVATNVANASMLAAKYPGAIVSIEGQNEINNSGVSQPAAVAYQRQLYAAVKADPNLKGVPVLDFTGGVDETSLSGQADVQNTHPYPASGVQPFARLQQDFVVDYSASAETLPKQITESGYSTLLPSADGVNDNVQGEGDLNILVDAAAQGVQRTYLYQLLEAYPNFFSNSDTDYGAFRYEDNSPKPGAEALHNLGDQIPADAPSAPKTVTAGFYPPLDGTTHVLALTAADGTVYLGMVHEQPFWNAQTEAETDVPPTVQYVSLPGYRMTGFFDPQYDFTLPAANYIEQYQGNGVYSTGLFGFYTWTVFKPQ